jgi:hypothetical protein
MRHWVLFAIIAASGVDGACSKQVSYRAHRVIDFAETQSVDGYGETSCLKDRYQHGSDKSLFTTPTSELEDALLVAVLAYEAARLSKYDLWEGDEKVFCVPRPWVHRLRGPKLQMRLRDVSVRTIGMDNCEYSQDPSMVVEKHSDLPAVSLQIDGGRVIDPGNVHLAGGVVRSRYFAEWGVYDVRLVDGRWVVRCVHVLTAQ